jgi:hypothetical protein
MPSKHVGRLERHNQLIITEYWVSGQNGANWGGLSISHYAIEESSLISKLSLFIKSEFDWNFRKAVFKHRIC